MTTKLLTLPGQVDQREDTRTRNLWSVGCELQPSTDRNTLNSLRNKGLIDHVQITIPNTLHFEWAAEASSGLKIIVHSNLLNTLGSNNWSELALFAQQIRALRPLHVVEHFTALRPSPTEKAGVHLGPLETSEKFKQATIDNIKRWQDLTGAPIALENAPVTQEVDRYFESLLEVIERAGAQSACDVAHLYISAYAASYNERRIAEVGASLKPSHIHLAGIAQKNGIVRDNHKTLSNSLLRLANKHFPNALYATVEQSHEVPPKALETWLNALKAKNQLLTPTSGAGGKSGENSATNDELAKETSAYLGLTIPIRKLQAPIKAAECEAINRTALGIYQTYLPFIFPLQTFKASFDDLEPKEALLAITRITRWALSYLSWTDPEAPRWALIRFGEGNLMKFEKKLTVPGGRLHDSTVEAQLLRFSSAKGFWLEVALPKISNLDATPGGTSDDANAV